MNADDLARERCERLFQLAKSIYAEDKELAKRYVSLARKIAMRHRIHLPKEFCRKCLAIRIEGKTVKTRLAKGMIEKTCAECGAKTRRKFSKKSVKEGGLKWRE
jgi:ribonuclease P protein subunit RPR2